MSSNTNTLEVDSETLSVDAGELSDATIRDMVEEGDLKKEEAESLGNDIWLNEIETGEPDKTGAISYLKNISKICKTKASDTSELFKNRKTILSNIESVERTHNDKIRIHIQHGRLGKKRVRFSPDSTELANLLEWKNVDNPNELEGLTVPILRDSIESNRNYILIPHNVSSTGRLRFLLYNGVEEIREKSKISVIHSDSDLLFFNILASSIITGTTATVGVVVREFPWLELIGDALILPFILTVIVIGFLIVYTLFRSSLLVLSGMFDSDYIEVQC